MGIITDIIKGLPLTAIQSEKITQLEKRLIELETENTKLKESLTRYEAKAGEKCPRCQKQTFNLESNKPNAIFGKTGVKDYLFTCSECSFSEEFTSTSASQAWKAARGG